MVAVESDSMQGDNDDIILLHIVYHILKDPEIRPATGLRTWTQKKEGRGGKCRCGRGRGRGRERGRYTLRRKRRGPKGRAAAGPWWLDEHARTDCQSAVTYFKIQEFHYNLFEIC